MGKAKLSIRFCLLLLVGGLIMLSSCKKDDDNGRPSTDWSVEYVLTSIGEVTIDRITYIDEFQKEQTITGQREFRLTFDAQSGFAGRLEIRGKATNGGVIASINATALDGTFRTVSNSANDGQSGGTSKNISLAVVLILP